jgi:tetratricopeptide (TPR) repeat protein
VLAKLERLLEINPKDVLVKEQLTNYWQAKANYVYERGNYKEAKKRLENALKYTDDDKMKTLIQKAFESCDEKISRGEDKPYLSDTPPPTIPIKDVVDIPRTHHFVLPKIAVAATGICAGIYALVINSTWNSKLNALTAADKVGDPTNSGFMASSGSYTTYKAAYDDAKNYQSKQALRNACVGIAIGAALVETYLFVKPKPATNAFRISPASQSVGLALQYKF